MKKESRMKTIRIATVAVLMVASASALRVVWAEHAVNPSANENREEQSSMTNEKVIMLIEAKIQPPRRAELVEAHANTCRWCGLSRASKRSTSRHEKTIPIHLFFTRFTGRKQHRISICNRISLKNFGRR
jgi:hypothetical protein